jgi:1,4-alpha-glucan branching enzyme
MDGIVEINKVSREQIKIVIKDSSHEWTATTHHQTEEMLSFIRYTEKKGKAVLELTNFNAQLSRKALDMGVSSKRNSESTAGTHGEGFKVASLVMVRKGFQVRYESAKFY